MSKTSQPRKTTCRTRSRRRRSPSEPWWADLPTEELLQVRLCDLELKIEGTIIQQRIERLYRELERRGIRFRPHFWLSEEWFSPDGVPGIAVPFYLAHPRLLRLERKFMLEVEGSREVECMRILRHEAGHAIDTAYQLHRRRRWRELFGRYSKPYPDYYSPKPYSRSYVLHLDLWYAQSHPAEDFAETFAVWLAPGSRWRKQYEGWPALKKLEYVDELMKEIRDSKPLVHNRCHVAPLRDIRKTLQEYYDEKRKRYAPDLPDKHDRELLKLFSASPEHADKPSAAAFLRRIAPELRRTVARWTGQYQYAINQVLEEMIHRCRELNLRVAKRMDRARRDALVMLTVQTMNYLYRDRHRVVL